MQAGSEQSGSGEIEARARWGRDEAAQRERLGRVVLDHVPEAFIPRIEAAPFFFLATSGRDGSCDCSFKGGGPGLVRFGSTRACAFPDYDGNELFMSLGNILENPHVGMLFIDFADGARLRISGRAEIVERDGRRIVEVAIEQVVLNCARFIPRMTFVE